MTVVGTIKNPGICRGFLEIIFVVELAGCLEKLAGIFPVREIVEPGF